MLNKHTEEFTNKLLKDIYFRFEYAGLLEGLK